MDHNSFWLICDDNKQNCHCDWRVTIVDCIEREPMLYIYIVNAIWSLIICIIGSGLLFHRVVNKKLPIFDYSSPYGFFIRPKPIESMLLFGLVFNFLRIIDNILLITDAAPNPIFRAFLYELPWQFGICAFACYLFGIAHTVSSSTKLFENQWFEISIKIDIICSIMITMPFLTNNVCSIAAAVYASKGDMAKAKIFTDALYYLWTFYCFTLAMWILFAGLKLIYLLERHLDNQRSDDPNGIIARKVRNGLFKVRMIMSISITSLLIFSFIKCCYGIIRVPLLGNNGLNLAIAVVWTYDGTLASMLVVMTVIFNPKALTSLSISSSSTNSSTFYHSSTKSNFIMHKNNVKSYNASTIVNDESVMTTKSGYEMQKDDYFEEDPKNSAYYYYYNSQIRQNNDEAHLNPNHFQQSISKLHLMSP